MKPNEIDAIIDMRQIKEFEYINLREAGNPMQAKVLNWLFQYILKNGLNAVWQVNGGVNWCGSPEFNSVMELENQKDEQADWL